MNGFIYSLCTPLVITRNYSPVAISTLYNSLLHKHTRARASPLLVTQLTHKNYNSLIELRTPDITHDVFTAALLQLTRKYTALHCTLNSFP
jgi:hypothetical protein